MPQFTFRLDNGQTLMNDGSGRVRFDNASLGYHYVSETIPFGWTQVSVTPAGGYVNVLPGTCSAVTIKNRQFIATATVTYASSSSSPYNYSYSSAPYTYSYSSTPSSYYSSTPYTYVWNSTNVPGNWSFENTVNVNSAPPQQVAQQSYFLDIDNGSPEGRAANYLAGRSIIGGFPDHTFRGGNLVNRAEITKFALLAKGINVPNSANNGQFWDVRDGEWYVSYVMEAARRSIIQGYQDGSMRPANPVTTAEFLKIITITFNLQQGMPYSYSDVSGNDWFSPYAGAASRYNLFPSHSQQFLDPNHQMTRSEVAVALAQLLTQLGQ